MAQRLETIIAINAQVGNGFSQVGATLSELGSMVNGMSQELINFGKESVEVYRNYELSMKDAEVALSTNYGRGTRELQNVMTQLDASATEWAATTIFHTNDVANAIAEAAHAGWDLDQILTGIPEAIELAQAGSIDLSEAVDFIVKATNAAGIEFDQTGNFIDHWTYAANTSATTVEEMGEAMLKMGATMKFAGGTDELLVMLAELADAGTTGTAAGTLLRNSMLRLVAPTKKANDAMLQLGATSDEAAAVLNDEALAAANARLAQAGFSAYDESGNLKSMLDTYRDLYVALGDIAGGYDQIGTNEESLSIISSIFPTRSITAALALLEAAGEGYSGLFESLQGGDAEGYGQYAAETMMDSLHGSIETFESKVERLKQVVGEELSGQLENVLSTAGQIVDTLAEMDEGPFSAVIRGLEVLAGAGPALLIAGGGLRFIGSALTLFTSSPVFAIAGLALAIGTFTAAMEELDAADYANKFGELQLDTNQVEQYLTEIKSQYESAYGNINDFRMALDQAVETYEKASSTFKSKALTDSLTEAKLTEEQIESYKNLGQSMIDAVNEGIEANYGSTTQTIMNAFGANGQPGAGSEEDAGIWGQIMSVMEQGYQADIDRANELSQQLRDAMTSAFKDKTLTSDEVANIQAIMDEYNQLLAEQQERVNAQERARLLQRSQTLGLEGIEEVSQMAMSQRDAELEELAATQAGARFDVEHWYDRAIEEGWMVPEYDENGQATGREHVATASDRDAALSQLSARQTQEMQSYGSDFNEFLMGLWMEGIQGSELSGTWTALEDLAASYRQAGGVVTENASRQYIDSGDFSERQDVGKYLNSMIEALGGYESLLGYADYYAGQGNEAAAQQYQMLADMYDILGREVSASPIAGYKGTGDFSEAIGTRDEMASLMQGTGWTPEMLVSHIVNDLDGALSEGVLQEQLGSSLYNTLSGAASEAGLSLGEWIGNIQASMPDMTLTPVLDDTLIDIPLDPIPVQIEPHVQGEDAQAALQEQGVTVDVQGDTASLSATIDGEDGQTLMEYVDGDATDLRLAIFSEDGQTLIEHVTGNTAALAAAIERYQGMTIRVNLVGRQMFASGGRATTASIFGEAGPEWAIPEEHSERTASLLNAAREASGFTWADLLSRFGGMNANPDHAPATIVYSPTIHAADAAGVEQVLRADKDRLFKWLEEKRIRDEMEVYA